MQIAIQPLYRSAPIFNRSAKKTPPEGGALVQRLAALIAVAGALSPSGGTTTALNNGDNDSSGVGLRQNKPGPCAGVIASLAEGIDFQIRTARNEGENIAFDPGEVIANR